MSSVLNYRVKKRQTQTEDGSFWLQKGARTIEGDVASVPERSFGRTRKHGEQHNTAPSWLRCRCGWFLRSGRGVGLRWLLLLAQ